MCSDKNQRIIDKWMQLVEKDLSLANIPWKNVLGDRRKFRVWVKTVKFPDKTDGRKEDTTDGSKNEILDHDQQINC